MKQKILQNLFMTARQILFGVLLQCFFYSFLLASEGKAQAKSVSEVTINLDLNNARITDVFRAIEKQTEFKFVFSEEAVPDDVRISISPMNSQSVRDVLLSISKLAGLKFQQVAWNISVRKFVRKASNEERVEIIIEDFRITGRVTSKEDGLGLPGVTVLVKGTSVGTVTDAEGNYAVDAVDGNSVLQFSSIGYVTQEVNVGGRSVIDVILVADVTALEEVVVVGYGTQRSEDVTGSVATVDEEALKDLPVSTIDQKIIGQVAGVQILQVSGAPGAGTSVKIRGSGSLGAGNEPLYVVDGMPYSSGMNQTMNPLLFINPNDIETITVLKDASSTAIYGSRGANGVIMITTKKADYEQTQVNVSSMRGVQQVPQKGRPQLLNKREFAELQRDRIDILVRRSDNREPVESDYPVEYQNLDQLTGEGTDWYDLLLQTAVVQDHNISVQKGSKDTRMNFSLGYFKQEGTVKYTGLERYSSKLSIESQIGKAVTISATLQPTFIEQTRTNTNDNRSDILGVANWANPIMSPYDANGKLIPYIQSPKGKYHSAWSFANPLFVLRETTQTEKEFQNLGSAFVEWNITPELKAKSMISTVWSTSKYFQYVPSTVGGNNKPPVEGTGRSTSTRNESFNWLIENTVNYNKTVGDHRFNALLGYTTQKFTANGIDLNATPYPNDLIQTINAAQAIGSWGESFNEWSMISYLGRINYAFKDRYLLTATFRSDGSSRFGTEKRYAMFPSLAGAWRVSEEAFMDGNKIISDLKLRVSYGESGNNNIGNYRHLASINSGSYIFGNEQVTASYVGLSNPFLTWEESRQIDLGVDLELFDGRLSFIADLYNRESENMLLDNIIPAITGFNTQTINQGKVRNRGIELSLGGAPVTGDFYWDVNANIAFNRNEILALNDNGDRILAGNNDGNPTHISVVGKPIGQFFGYIFDGLYTAEDLVNPDVAKFPTVYEGAAKYVDVNGDGVVTDLLDYAIIGNPHPDFIYGITNNFRYKNFDLGVIVNGQYGGQVVNGLRSTVDNLQGFFNVSKEWANRWRSPDQTGDGQHYGVPVLFPSTGHRMSDRWVEDASYLRIANLTLGYTMPQKWMEKSRVLNNGRLYMTIQNLATFTDYGGANPEAQGVRQDNTLAPGFDMTPYPLSRTASIGINLSF